MSKIKTGDIQDLNISWENYSGESVEKFIKEELGGSCGYIYRTPTKEGDYYYLYGFHNYEDFAAWLDGSTYKTYLFKVQLPNIENDTFAVNLTTNSNTSKLVNLGDGVIVNLRYTSTSTNPSTQVTSDTYNDGTLIIMRSANGSAYSEVGRITLTPINNTDTDKYQAVNLTPYLADGENKIRLRVEDTVNGSVSANLTFLSIINTTLKVTNATSTSSALMALQFSYYIEGLIAKTLHLKLTPKNGTALEYEYKLGSNTYTEVPYTTPVINLELDSQTITVDAYLTVDDTELQSATETNQFFYVNGSADGSTIVLNNVNKSVSNYANTHFFDFTLYGLGSDVEITIKNGTSTYLTYKFVGCEIGTTYSFYNVLEIESDDDTLSAVVTAKTSTMTSDGYTITIDNSEKMSPISGADFTLKPKERENSELSPARIINAETGNEVSATFTGFKFLNDGWVSDDDEVKVLRIPAKHSLVINYDPLDTLTDGTTIELDYKVFNIYNDSDVVFSFTNNTASGSPLGFIMNAIEAAYYTAENQTKRDQDVMFQEDTRTHMVINIIPNLSGSGLNYIRIFINGIMNREMLYTATDVFKNGTMTLNFGSDNCDLDIYGLRIYKKALSASDIRQNYMSSIPNSADKVAFKTANDILSANGTISYDKACVKYNTLVWTGKHPEYTTGKVKYFGNLGINIVGDTKHSGTINNLQISGQGSSSRGYWKWNHQYDFNTDTSKGDKTISKFINKDGETLEGYQLTDDDAAARLLVAKLNWASSQQSHKLGSTAMYSDLWKKIVGGNSITKTSGYETSAVSVHEKPFLYFIKDTDTSTPVFAGLVTFGAGKKDVPTFQGNAELFPDYLMVEGSDNGMPVALRQVPWIDSEVTYNADEEYWEYNGQGNIDFTLGDKSKISYISDAFNFTYLHSIRLKPYTADSELVDKSYQYWNTSTYKVKRYDYISESWVDAGITCTTPCVYHYTTDEDVKAGTAEKAGVKIIDSYPVYAELNIKSQTGVTPSGTSSTDNALFIAWRKSDFKSKLSTYYNVNDVIYCIAFLKLIAASDNRCKNTYEYIDPVTHKICMAQDDMDTIMLTDNVGRKVKPYYVEEFDTYDNGTKNYFNGADSVFYGLIDSVYDTEIKAMMKSIFDTMTDSYGSASNTLQHYYFDVLEYFPAVAYNETARLLYEEASVAQSKKLYSNGTPAISQSLGDQLQAEKQWWKRRLPYLQSWASADPFYTRSTVEANQQFRSLTTTSGSNPEYSFSVTPWLWLYPKVGTGQSMGSDNTRVQAQNTYSTTTLNVDGNTDTFIYGANYYTSFGEFGGVSLGEAFVLNGTRLLEFSADSRKVDSYQFRPTSMLVICPALKKLVIYGCSTLAGALDLSADEKLEEVDLRGSSLTSIVFPQTETLTSICIPNVANLTLRNCPNLTEIVTDGTYSNLISLNTDNSDIAVAAVKATNSLATVNLYKVDIDLSDDATGSDKLYNLLAASASSCSGKVKLNKTLTQAEKATLVTKYGNIDSTSNDLYVSYTVVSADSVSITGQDELAQGRTTNYVATYAGNDVKSYTWTITGATYKKISATEVLITASTENLDSITVQCVVTKTSNATITESKTITVIEDIVITDISVEDIEIDATGEYTIPITITPSNYTCKVTDVKAILGVNDYATITSYDKDSVVLTATGTVTNEVKNVSLQVTITDADNNKFTKTSRVCFANPVTAFLINGVNIGI